jgi:hypothetical protein
MPASVVVLLLAGWAAEGSGLAWSGRKSQLEQSLLLKAATVVVVPSVVALQWVSWFTNAHRSADGTAGPLLFLRHADWTPPGGWPLWFTLATMGCIAIAAGAVRSVQHSDGPAAG